MSRGLGMTRLTDAQIDERIRRYHDMACGYQIKLAECQDFVARQSQAAVMRFADIAALQARVTALEAETARCLSADLARQEAAEARVETLEGVLRQARWVFSALPTPALYPALKHSESLSALVNVIDAALAPPHDGGT